MLDIKENGMSKLGQPTGASPMLCFRVTEEAFAALKVEANKAGVTVSEMARQWMEKGSKDYYRSEAARRLRTELKKGDK
jgi:hypothetical protein